jgi:hypothetical protein
MLRMLDLRIEQKEKARRQPSFFKEVPPCSDWFLAKVSSRGFLVA